MTTLLENIELSPRKPKNHLLIFTAQPLLYRKPLNF